MGIPTFPDGVPTMLAMSIAINGYTEAEAHEIMVEGGDAVNADEWMVKLTSAGYFRDVESLSSTEAVDGGSVLWNALLQELEKDESGFKHRIAVLDNAVKGNIPRVTNDLSALARGKSSSFLPFSSIQDKCPWHGCKMAAMAVLHLVSLTDAESKRQAIRSVCRSLGGCAVPAEAPLANTRWPYLLSQEFHKATLAVQTRGACISLHINVTDVEIKRNPAKRSGTTCTRPGTTFAHTCVMTVSPAGVYLYHAYGPRGYTLLQHMQKRHSSYPMSILDAQAWVKRFEGFAAALQGVWTTAVNDAYSHCFDVDLVELGNMRVGSQLDAYVSIDTLEFDAALVRQNFNLLPQPEGYFLPACSDGADAKSSEPHPKYIPDGGVKHYYVPIVLRCGNCGIDGACATKQCGGCKVLRYCSKECQKHDWKCRHKAVCKEMANLP